MNADDRYFALFKKRARGRVVSFGLAARADVRAEEIEPYGRDGTQFKLVLPGRSRRLLARIRVPGEHNVTNALAAAATGVALDVPGSAIVAGLAKFRPAAMRSQIEVRHGVRIIVDCYNANPASTRAAVRLLAESKATGRRIAVLGDMLELGPTTAQLHAEVGAYVAEQGIDTLIASGPLARNLAGARAEPAWPPCRKPRTRPPPPRSCWRWYSPATSCSSKARAACASSASYEALRDRRRRD